MSTLTKILLGISVASIFVLSDYLSAQWGKTSSTTFFVLMVVTAPIAYIFFGVMAKWNGLAVTSGLVNTWIVIGSIAVGLVFFKEKITQVQTVGLLLAVLAVYLLAGDK